MVLGTVPSIISALFDSMSVVVTFGFTTRYDFGSRMFVLSVRYSCASGTPSPSVSTLNLSESISSSRKSYRPSLSVSSTSRNAFEYVF